MVHSVTCSYALDVNVFPLRVRVFNLQMFYFCPEHLFLVILYSLFIFSLFLFNLTLKDNVIINRCFYHTERFFKIISRVQNPAPCLIFWDTLAHVYRMYSTIIIGFIPSFYILFYAW